jgi:hypothetical protein
MGKIILSEDEIIFLSKNYPKLEFNSDKNTISGGLQFDLTYKGKRLQGEYSVKILLYSPEGSCLPTVYEVSGTIQQIANRKKITIQDLHLNSTNGEMCIIIPPKEKERYPNGFDLQKYLYHLEEHLYWITYFDRYEKKPWKDQAHSDIGFLELFKEDKKKYRQDVKLYFERKNNNKFINRQQFNSFMRKQLKANKL